MLEFKKYTSRFVNGVFDVVPTYQTIEAIQNIDFNKNILKSLIESKTPDLSDIYQRDYYEFINYPITCKFDSINGEPPYTITIHPGDYLIWDEEIHRFIAMPESVFLALYKET